MSKVVLITGCSTRIGHHLAQRLAQLGYMVSDVVERAIKADRPKARYLAAIPLSGKLVIHLRDFVWGSVLKQMFKINPLEMPS